MTDEQVATTDRAFGEESRRDLLTQYFASLQTVHPAEAWKHVYRLLLWIDKTTGLAHCYESDKSQPGRPWYARSLAFHDWLAKELAAAPTKLGDELDWLFIRGSERLATTLIKLQAKWAVTAQQQRAKYGAFPQPGEDPGLEKAILEELKEWLPKAPPADVMRRLSQRVRAYLSQENKRKNLLGEGFEDVLAFLVKRLPRAERLNVIVRPVLHELPGFRHPRGNEKARTVDLAVVSKGGQKMRRLITAKWSVRADREEQFAVDFEAYARLEEAGQDFQYVLVTNEFDAARLAAACDRRAQNASLFSNVVHVNPKGPLSAYGAEGRRAAERLPELVSSGRLMSLEGWLKSLTTK